MQCPDSSLHVSLKLCSELHKVNVVQRGHIGRVIVFPGYGPNVGAGDCVCGHQERGGCGTCDGYEVKEGMARSEGAHSIYICGLLDRQTLSIAGMQFNAPAKVPQHGIVLPHFLASLLVCEGEIENEYM